MARSQRKHDRVGFVVCTSLAIGVIVVMWAWSVRSIVGQGVQGTKAVISDVSAVAGETRRQAAPDPEAIEAVKEGLKSIVSEQVKQEEPVPQESETADAPDAATIDAVAQLMKHDVETYGEEPKN